MKKQEELYSFPQQNDGAVVETDIRMIPLSELHDFNGHPFKVENDMALFELMQSIEKEGVVVLALARPREYDAYCDRMGYTTEKLASIRYKMSLYDEFLEEYNYRKKHFGISDASRMVAVSEKSR